MIGAQAVHYGSETRGSLFWKRELVGVSVSLRAGDWAKRMTCVALLCDWGFRAFGLVVPARVRRFDTNMEMEHACTYVKIVQAHAPPSYICK